MATIKVKYRPSSVANQQGVIFYQILHARKTRLIFTEYHIFISEWDKSRSMVITSQTSERKSLILSIRENIRRDIERLNKIARKLDNNLIDYTSDDVIDEFNRYTEEYTLFNFMERIIAKLKHNGKTRTSETYTAARNSFRNFLSDTKLNGHLSNTSDLMLDSITPEIMERYEAWHKNRGNTPNTISFYMRILRAVYNRAVEDGIIEDRKPFRHVYTGVDKTIKRALPLSAIKKLNNLDLTQTPTLDYARDMFILSFMLRGMSFIDMAYLKKTDLKNGSVIYRRHKTGQLLTIEWTKEMRRILKKYPENKSRYLLPIIKNPNLNDRYAYKNAGDIINRSLKKIATIANINFPLTMYVARHSWASAAKAKGIPLSVISEGMGHDSEATTQIYLASLETSIVDKANSLILSSI